MDKDKKPRESQVVKALEREYEAMLSAGTLFDMFPAFTGEWEKDKKYFITVMISTKL